MNYYKIVLFSFLMFSSLGFCQSIEEEVKILDNYIENGIKTWQPPGLAVTVVKNAKIVFTKGYGVRTLGEKDLVDENTLFGCMSTTKAFISAGMAMLVDDGKVQWEDKVITYLPEFQLKDPYITRELTIRDLLTHRSGLGNSDYLWSIMTISSDSALYKMREVETSYSLRSSFKYQNLMYLAAGKVIEAVSGMTWGEFLKERIYLPLGMTNTFPLLKSIENIENKASAHFEIDGTITKIKQTNADNIGPAGSMWSSINDMGKWIQFLLNNGQKDMDTLIKPNTFSELFKPQQIIPSDEFYPSQQLTKPHWMTYGLGWFQHDYRGKMVQFHTGSLAGMVAIAGMIPEENIGIYIMGNLDHVELRHAIMYATFDLFMDGKITRDWSTDLYELYHPEKEKVEEPQPIANAKPSLMENDILGKFGHDKYGWIEISQQRNGLHFNINDTAFGSLKHWQYDTYQGSFEKKYWGKTMVTFRMGEDGKISHLEMWGERFDKAGD